MAQVVSNKEGVVRVVMNNGEIREYSYESVCEEKDIRGGLGGAVIGHNRVYHTILKNKNDEKDKHWFRAGVSIEEIEGGLERSCSGSED